MYFKYGKKEIAYLKEKDKKLGAVIDKIGIIKRDIDDNLFTALVHNIVGQQISNKALDTIWKRLQDTYKNIEPKTLNLASIEELKAIGISSRKGEYIKDFCKKIISGDFQLEAIKKMSDEDAIQTLSSLKGVGVWTAEMILLFCLQRPNVLSYNDLAIQRGMRMVYHHKKIDKKLFEKYRKRLSPYCSVASLYFWSVAGGSIPEMKDYAQKETSRT